MNCSSRRFLGRDFHNRFCVPRVLMQAVHYRRSREKVAKGHVDLCALRNPNKWTGYLKRFAFLGECVDLHARTGVGFRVPITLPQFEVKRSGFRSPIFRRVSDWSWLG